MSLSHLWVEPCPPKEEPLSVLSSATPGLDVGTMTDVNPPTARSWDGTRVSRSASPSPNSRYSTQFSRYSSTTAPITGSRQERQIVQSWLDLDDFLPAFTSLLKELSGVRSNHLSYRPLQGQKS